MQPARRARKTSKLSLRSANNSNPTSVMVFLSSHVVCSGSSALQFPLLQILNESIGAPAALKLKSQSLTPLLERCRDGDYIRALLKQDPQIDTAEFTKRLMEIVTPGSSSAQVNILLDLVSLHGPVSAAACQQLAVIFPTAGQSLQLHIAQSLVNQLESGPQVSAFWIICSFDRISRRSHQIRLGLYLFPQPFSSLCSRM